MTKSQTDSQNIERDLIDARALLADSRRIENGEKYRKAAKIILLKILNLDPAHAEARALLEEATVSGPKASPSPAPVIETPVAPKPQLPPRDELKFTAAYSAKPVETTPAEPSRAVGKLPLALTVMVALAGGWLLVRPNAATKVVQADTATTTPAPAAPSANGESSVTPVSEPEALVLQPAAVVPVKTSPSDAIVNPTPRATVPQEPGSLAVNSPIAADIYMGEKLVGSTPTTLNLPAGPVTLEYRHGNLRTTMTHDIKSKETTTALVSFDTTVQINARPWAQVFVEGTQRRALGQTPLGSVHVPIGSVLTFENPNFGTKSYRITEKDSSIQVVFP
jgi:hypothetical protein